MTMHIAYCLRFSVKLSSQGQLGDWCGGIDILFYCLPPSNLSYQCNMKNASPLALCMVHFSLCKTVSGAELSNVTVLLALGKSLPSDSFPREKWRSASQQKGSSYKETCPCLSTYWI